jgi:transposase
VLNTRIARWRTDNRKLSVFGAMLLNGRDVAMISEGSKAGDFIRFLGAVRRENPENTLLLILDNARIHHAKAVKRKCRGINVRLVHLPPYSPDLNPIEFAWKDSKKRLAMKGFEEIKEKVKYTLANIMEERKFTYSKAWMEKFGVLRGR